MGLGALLGLLNTVFIGAALALDDGEPEVIGYVLVFAGVPAVVLGTFLGFIARCTADFAVPFRLLVLVLPACALVWVLGSFFGLTELILVSMIPTVVCALVLEKRTRAVEPSVTVPPAVVQR